MAGKQTVVHLRVPEALRRRLAKAAVLNRRSMNAEAQVALEAHLSAEKEREK